ncbi:MAG TPA: NADH-quinone oxidoreductase subunit N, partial [Micromonosporaceae bacterium]|nr:NADH-quinone oxidoreductase subunit N [Micromonosporaceae bacterium]
MTALAADTFTLLPIDYAAIAPMLVLFGVACLGVLVEAFTPRVYRYPVQLGLALLGLVGALVVVIVNRGKMVVTAGGELAIDGPALFLQGSIIVLGIVALLLVAERALEVGGPFVAQASVVVGSEEDRRQAGK